MTPFISIRKRGSPKSEVVFLKRDPDICFRSIDPRTHECTTFGGIELQLTEALVSEVGPIPRGLFEILLFGNVISARIIGCVSEVEYHAWNKITKKPVSIRTKFSIASMHIIDVRYENKKKE